MPDCDSYFIQKSKEISQTIQMDKRCKVLEETIIKGVLV